MIYTSQIRFYQSALQYTQGVVSGHYIYIHTYDTHTHTLYRIINRVYYIIYTHRFISMSVRFSYEHRIKVYYLLYIIIMCVYTYTHPRTERLRFAPFLLGVRSIRNERPTTGNYLLCSTAFCGEDQHVLSTES